MFSSKPYSGTGASKTVLIIGPADCNNYNGSHTLFREPSKISEAVREDDKHCR